MSSPRSIRNLAAQAGITPDDALARLQAAGLPQKQVSQSVARSDLLQAQVALGLAQPTAHQPSATIGTLNPPPTPPISSIAPPARAPVTVAPSVKESESGMKGPVGHQYDLPLVGHPSNDIKHLSISMVRAIYDQLEKDYQTSEDPIDSGERDQGAILDAALTRPHTSAGGRLKYPTVEMAAAALMHAMVQDHPFHDGNKRTAIVSLLVFLDQNNFVFTGEEDDLFNTVLKIASHQIVEEDNSSLRDDKEMHTISLWIRSKSRKLSKRAENMQWMDLRSTLISYGCDVDRKRGNKITIRRGNLVSYTGARNDGHEISGESISKIRKDLKLSEEDGVDSEVFYYGASRISGFINKYRKTLDDFAAYDRTG